MAKIPTYEVKVDDVDSPNPAVNMVALVDNPAIERGWMMFAKDGELQIGDPVQVIPGKEHIPQHKGVKMIVAEINGTAIAVKLPDGSIHKWYTKEELQKIQSSDSKFAFKVDPAKKERRIITGPLMLADIPIYRRTPERGEFNVVFRRDTIETIVKKFAKGNHYNNVNLMHSEAFPGKGIYLIESFLIDEERGIKTPALFDKAPDGSWFASYYVEDDRLWNEYIIKGYFTGFSVECFMDVLFRDEKDPIEQFRNRLMEISGINF